MSCATDCGDTGALSSHDCEYAELSRGSAGPAEGGLTSAQFSLAYERHERVGKISEANASGKSLVPGGHSCRLSFFGQGTVQVMGFVSSLVLCPCTSYSGCLKRGGYCS